MQATSDTITYIAKPADSRCQWWSSKLERLTVAHLSEERAAMPYLRRNADLELEHGEMLIDSEANHHRNSRGYTVTLGVALVDKMVWIQPSMEIKQYIKANGGKHIMKGSGDVTAVIRMALWLREQPDLEIAFRQLQTVNKSEDQ